MDDEIIETTTFEPLLADNVTTSSSEDEDTLLPSYVCCVVTEGVWTWFGASLLILVLFSAATLKYCKKRLSKPRFRVKNQNLLLRHVLADDRKAVSQVESRGPIKVEDFSDYYSQRRKHKTINKLEYSKVVNAATKHSWSCARLECNVRKNQSLTAIPFDYNRVRLELEDNSKDTAEGSKKQSVANRRSSVTIGTSFASSDYINASYISSRGDPYGLIVGQGPLEHTLGDFWQLVWQAESPCIVMLTKTYETIKVMCHQYWPIHLGKPERYNNFTVTTNWEEVYAHYKVREFTVSRRGCTEQRQVLHYHYQEWPAHANPPPNSLIQFRRRLMEDMGRLRATGCSGRPVVHCHEGGSRSGTFLAMHRLLCGIEQERQVDVFETVKDLLNQRRCLVPSPEHLRYIYDVVEDHILCGDSFIPIGEILPRLQEKSKRDPITRENTYTREHRLLNSLLPRFTIGDCAAGHRAENRAMNRNVLVVPPDSSRPYLTTFLNNDSTDYINAVFVDGYRRSDEFICTEWPMSNTLASFWSMIYDHDIHTIVVLNHNKPSAVSVGSGAFPTFWPTQEGGRKTFSPVFAVEHVSSTSEEGKFESWNLRLMKQDVAPHRQTSSSSKEKKDLNSLSSLLKSMQAPSKAVRLFQIQCWPSAQKVPNSTLALVHLIDEVERWRGNINNLGSSSGSAPSPSFPSSSSHGSLDKVVIVSNDGVSRCGIYCVAAACLEQVYHRAEVDVFQAVKTVRKHRPQLVAHPLEYKYCYDVVLHYVLNYCRTTEGEASNGTVIPTVPTSDEHKNNGGNGNSVGGKNK